MMMRFTKVAENIQAALVQFCMEQKSMNGYADKEDIEALVESAFAVMNRIPQTSVKVLPIYRYHMYTGEQYTDEIFPDSIKENGVLYDRIIHIGTFVIDSYAANSEGKRAILRGYDVVYDLDSQEIKLLYHIMTADESVTTLYRVDTDLFEVFDVYEFMIDISSQMIGKLKQSLSIPVIVTVNKKERAA